MEDSKGGRNRASLSECLIRLGALLVFVLTPFHLWYSGGVSDADPIAKGLFFVAFTGGPLAIVAVAFHAGWLSRENLTRSWGWLWGHKAK